MRILILIQLIFFMYILQSCTSSEKEINVVDIQGSWVFDSSDLPQLKNNRILSKIRDNCGFKFDKDLVYLNCSLYKKMANNACNGMGKGGEAPFSISGDSLKIWNTQVNAWHLYLIKKLSVDSLILFDYNMNYDLKYIRPKMVKSEFDEIIVSKIFIGDGDDCLDEVFNLKSTGNYFYKNSLDEVSSGSFEDKSVSSLFSNFRFLNLNGLKDEYIGGGTGSSVHYSITFLKDNKILKRVIDNQNTSPDELLMGYIPIINQIRLHKTKEPIKLKIPQYVENEYQNFLSKVL